MPSVQLSTTPAINPNVRNAYVSLIDMLSWWAFENFNFMRQNGWSIKWTCDGTTGPTGAGDATNRIPNRAAFQVRAAVAAAAQSYFVVEGTDVQILVAFQGASDSIARISYSPGKLFVLAGDTTHQPTAADELVISAGNSIVNTAVTLDRVMSIWSSATMWSNVICRSNALVGYMGVEKVNSLVAVRAVNPIFTPPYIAYRYLNMTRDGSVDRCMGGLGANAIGAAGFAGAAARVYTDTARNIRLCGGIWILAGLTNSILQLNIGMFNAEKPALQNGEGSPLIPGYFCGEKASQQDGLLCSGIDWWVPWTNATNTPGTGDQFNGFDPADNPLVDVPRSNWLVAIGPTAVRPWRNAAATMQIT